MKNLKKLHERPAIEWVKSINKKNAYDVMSMHSGIAQRAAWVSAYANTLDLTGDHGRAVKAARETVIKLRKVLKYAMPAAGPLVDFSPDEPASRVKK